MQAKYGYPVKLFIGPDTVLRSVPGSNAEDALENAKWLYPHASRIELRFDGGTKVFTREGALNANAKELA